jgi:hypothetical protein
MPPAAAASRAHRTRTCIPHLKHSSTIARMADRMYTTMYHRSWLKLYLVVQQQSVAAAGGGRLDATNALT